MLVLFNFLPAFPMDGGRVLRAFMAMRLGYNRATQIAARIGQVIAIGLGFFGLINGTPMLILIAFFVFAAAASEAGAAQLMDFSRGLSVGSAMVTDFRTMPRNASLGEAVEVLLHSSQHEFPVVDPDGNLRGLFTRNDLVTALRESGPGTLVTEVMRTDFPVINARTPFKDAVRMMQEQECSVLPVTDGEGRLVGLFTLENIGEMMMVRSAIAQSRGDNGR
jgi:stage IV sporulation protein FB